MTSTISFKNLWRWRINLCTLRDAFLGSDFHDLDDLFHDLRYWNINDLFTCALRDAFLRDDLHDLDGLFQDLRYWHINDTFACGDSLLVNVFDDFHNLFANLRLGYITSVFDDELQDLGGGEGGGGEAALEEHIQAAVSGASPSVPLFSSLPSAGPR